MKSKVEIYWESSDAHPDPTVVDLVRDKKIPCDSICRVESDLGIRKSYLEVVWTSGKERDNDVDLKLAQAMSWVINAREKFGVGYPMILVNGLRIGVYLLRLELAIEENLEILETATADLKETRYLVRHSAIAKIRQRIEKAVDRLKWQTGRS